MGPIIEEQAVMERHQPGGVSDSQGSVTHGTRSVVGDRAQRQSSDIHRYSGAVSRRVGEYAV